MDREAWCAAVYGITKSWTWLNDWTELSMGLVCSFHREIFISLLWAVLLSQMHDFVIKMRLKNIEVNESRCETNNCQLLWGGSGSMVKNPPANAGASGLVGSTPGLGRSPGGGNGNPSSILAWRIPWTEEPGGLQSIGLQRVRHDWVTEHTHTQALSVYIYIICRQAWWYFQVHLYHLNFVFSINVQFHSDIMKTII